MAINNIGKTAYIYQGGTWYAISGSANTALNYSWSGTHTFGNTVTTEDVVIAKAGINNFNNPGHRDEVLQNPIRGIVCFIAENENSVRVDQLQYFDGSSWKNISGYKTISSKISSYILTASDNSKVITIDSASANTITVPSNLTTAIPVGYSVDIIQLGTGSTTVVAESVAVSIKSKNNTMSLDGQFSKATLIKLDTNTWSLSGDIYENVAPAPTPTAPTPTAPTPTAPTPTAPTPTAPTPTAPTPTAPTPTAPTPTAPTPTAPTPTAPTPTAPTPTAPTPTAPVTPSFDTLPYAQNIRSDSYTINWVGTNAQSWSITTGGTTVLATGDGNGGSWTRTGLTQRTTYTQTVKLWSGPNQTGTSVSDPITIYTIFDPLNSYWYTGCCSTNGAQVTGDSSVDFTYAYNDMLSRCPGGTISNQQSGHNQELPVLDCLTTPTPTAPTPTAPTPTAPTPTAPTPTAPTPTAPTPTAVPSGYNWNVAVSSTNVDCASGTVVPGESGSGTGTGAYITVNTSCGTQTFYGINGVPYAYKCCQDAPAPTPTAPTPTAPTPTAPTPTAPTPTAPTPTAPTPTAPTPTAPVCTPGSTPADVTTNNCPSLTGVPGCTACQRYIVTAADCSTSNTWSCLASPTEPTPTAPTPTAPTPTAPTPTAPTPTAPTPTAPTPTAPTPTAPTPTAPTPTAVTYSTVGPSLGTVTCPNGGTTNTQYINNPGSYSISNGVCGTVSWYAYTTGTWYVGCCAN